MPAEGRLWPSSDNDDGDGDKIMMVMMNNVQQNALTGRLSLLPTDDLSKAAAMCLPPDYAGEW